MNHMKISVIIPTYNRAKTIEAAINSVLAQTFAVDEVIVVDDGSTDHTKEIVSKYGSKVKYISQQNSGASAARNYGVSIASNDWLAFLDSDDIWVSNKIDKQVSALEQTGALCCMTAHKDDLGQVFSHDEQQVENSTKLYAEPLHLIIALNRHPLMQSLLVHKSLVFKVGLLDQTLRVAEDTKFIFKLAYFFPIVYINTPLFVLTRDRDFSGLSDEISLEKAIIRYECYFRVQSEIYSLLLLKGSKLAKATHKNIGYFLGRLAELYAANDQHKRSRKLAIESLYYWHNLKTLFRAMFCIVFTKQYGRYVRGKRQYNNG